MLSVEPPATSAEPYVMGSTAAVLSVGLQVKQDYSFAWLHGKQPCMIRPDGHIAHLDAKGDIPYLRHAGKHRDPANQRRSRAISGVACVDGFVRVHHALPSGALDVAAPALYDGADKKKPLPKWTRVHR